MFETIEFESDDQVKSTPIPDGTTAPLKLRKDRETGTFFKSDGSPVINSGAQRKDPNKHWLSIPFEVAGGEHKGRWASMMLTVDSKDFQFRNTVKVVTGLDLGEPGQKLEFEKFFEALQTGVFDGKLGPEKKRDESGDLQETGFSKCFKLVERVGDRVEDEAPADEDAPMIGLPDLDAAGGDDDIPF
jgi:hypothetical protein